MQITILDRSNYFRGLLLLLRKDDRIALPEIQMMRRVGAALEFEKDFVETCIQELLEDTLLPEAPPLFSSPEIAMMFIKDGLLVASSDMHIDPAEDAWLRDILETNGLTLEWFQQQKNNIVYTKERSSPLEIERMIVK